MSSARLEIAEEKGMIWWYLRCFLLAMLLYSITLCVRFYSMKEIGLQSDERLWVSRSYELLKRSRTDVRHITSHLPHPGVTASAVLAVGHSIRENTNERRGCGNNKSCQAHVLDVSRISTTLLASLFVPVLFLGTIWFLGLPWAFLAAFLVSIDPRVIGYTRLAHIDGALTVFVCLTVLCYLQAIRKSSSAWRLGSALGWAGCLLTKPTGALMLPILVLYRTVRWLRNGCKVALVQWSDIWLVIVAHVVFVACFTRLWDKKSNYIGRLQVNSPLARWVFEEGRELHQYESLFLITLLGFAFLITALFFCWRQTGSKICYHAAHSLGLIGVIGAVFAAAPVILRNLILYWTWVSGLSGVKHEAFGKVFEAESAPGYLLIMGGEIPEAILCLFIFGILCVLWRLIRSRSEESLAIFCLLLSIGLWVGFLSTSSKQALRYVLPIIPFLYCIGVFGVKCVTAKIRSQIPALLLSGALVVYQAMLLLQWQPYVHTYFNHFVGGLKGAQERGRGYLFAGQIPAIEYLVEQAIHARQPLYVTVAGDLQSAEGVLNKYWPDLPIKIQFGQFPIGTADYVLVYQSHKNFLPADYQELLAQEKPVFTVPFQNATLAEVFALAPISLTARYPLSLDNAHRLTGDVVQNKSSQNSLRARAKVNPAGYLFFTDGVRLKAGRYRLTAEGVSGYDESDRALLRIELGKACSEILSTSGVKKDNSFQVSVECTIEYDARVIPRLYWFATSSITVNQLYLESVPGAPGTRE